MITTVLAKVFGTKNEREIKRMRPIVHQINLLEEAMLQLDDLDLTAKTNVFRERIARGEPLISILPEAFAVVRETSRRKLNMRHFDVQLMGGIVLHEGKIAEMKTGEGKTLVATLPLYLNALAGKGAHLITVNDYLAKRDAEWNAPLYNHLGLEVGIIQNTMSDSERKKAYTADITYGTNNEFGFDYLRDNMKFNLSDYVQRDLQFAIVDEVDSILIDEARTPLIISGPSERGSDLYGAAQRVVAPLKRDTDYEVDEKARSVHLTEEGTDKIESTMNLSNLYAPENINVVHHVQQALRANVLFKKDIEYVVRDGEVLIVDEFTGRLLPGRRYSDGLHQAIEAKESVKVERENQTLATITLQNYFRMYQKLAGMTGTAATEAAEFHKIYRLAVVSIPTHKPVARKDEADAVFLTKQDKFKQVIEDIKNCHMRGQPVLVGTIAIETSEYLSYLLTNSGIPHNVLNAKQHEREAQIVAEAGEAGRITIATNMAGRGTDIKLSQAAREAGGLRIIGTERHESRRIDNQLRGRSGRQGDPGSSKFYLSLEDDLMRIFGGEKLKRTLERLGMKPGDSIEDRMVSRSIEKAQERVEKHNFDIRKQLLEYDDVMNQQRTVIYKYRREILDGSEQTLGLVRDVIIDTVHLAFKMHCPSSTCTEEQLTEVLNNVAASSGIALETLQAIKFSSRSNATYLEEELTEFLLLNYEEGRAALNQEILQEAEKWILLETVDQSWKRHLQTIDHLKEGIGLRGYGYKNPLVEYKRELFGEFERMMHQIKFDVVNAIFKMRPETVSASAIEEIEKNREHELSELQMGGSPEAPASPIAPRRRESTKVGRNDPCPCLSGKKYKQCCGKES